jgi:hypothetical protein
LSLEHDFLANLNTYKWISTRITPQYQRLVVFVQTPTAFSSWTKVRFSLKNVGASGISVRLFGVDGNEISSIPINTSGAWSAIELDNIMLAALSASSQEERSIKVVFEVFAANGGSCYIGNMLFECKQFGL